MSAEVIPYYVEINLIIAIIIVIMLININSKIAYFNNEIMFKSSLWLTLIAIFADAVATGLEATIYPGSVLVNWVLDFIYFQASLAIPYTYLNYVKMLANKNYKLNNFKSNILSAPYVIFTVLDFSSPWTGLIFTIDEANRYTRGPLRPLHGIIAATVLVVSFIYGVVYAKRKKLPRDLEKCIVILPLFPLVGVIIRNIFQGSNMIWTGMVIGLFIIFINAQNSMISIDGMTRLSNRERCSEYLSMKLNDLAEGRVLYYTIFDINFFKNINDTYGHAEGDRAIKTFANALRDVCGNRDFAGRYGGDEFVIICERNIGENIDDMIDTLRAKIDEFNINENVPYKLTFSRGTSYTTKGMGKQEHALLVEADEAMYVEKNLFHKNDTINA